MSEDMIRSLNSEIARLNAELGTTRAEAAKYRKARQSVTRELDELKATIEKHVPLKDELKALRKEYEALKGQKDPAELQKKLADLESTVKQRAFKDVFEGVAKAKNVRPEALDKVLKLLEVDMAAEPDPEALKTSLEGFLKENPYFVGEGQPAEVAAEKPLKPGPGLGRGSTFADDLFTVRESDLHDLGWSERNGKRYSEAFRAGKVNYIDDSR